MGKRSCTSSAGLNALANPNGSPVELAARPLKYQLPNAKLVPTKTTKPTTELAIEPLDGTNCLKDRTTIFTTMEYATQRFHASWVRDIHRDASFTISV